MSVSNEIIKVLDELTKKFGVVIDWASQNVLPQIQDFLARYVKYEIVSYSIKSVISLIIVIIASIMMFKVIKPCINRDKESVFYDDYYHEMSLTGFIVGLVSGAAFLIALILGGFNIGDLIKWIIVPEFQFTKEISTLINA